MGIGNEKSPATNEALNNNAHFVNNKVLQKEQTLKTALNLCQQGFSIILANGKAPIGEWQKYQCQRKSKDEIKHDLMHSTLSNIGIVTGKISGIFVLDIDDFDGEETLRKLEAEHTTLPPSVEVITGKGRHVYFRYPIDAEIKNSVSKIGRNLDIRGEGGFVICPPSIHPSGRTYEWSVDCADEISEAPQWLISLVKTQPKQAPKTPPSDWQMLIKDGMSEGGRNHAIARLSGMLLRRYVDPHTVLELCQAWNMQRCKPPVLPREVETIVNSIAGRELARREGGKVHE